MINQAIVRRALTVGVTFLAFCFIALPAFASVTEEGAPNIMVRPFEGPKASALGERVLQVLEEQGADLVPAGFEGPTPLESDADFAAVAARLNIRAYVQGVSTNDTSGWTLVITIRQGSDGMVVGESEFKASWFPGLLTKVEKELIGSLEAALSGAAVPEEAPEEDDGDEDDDAFEEEEETALQPLSLRAGMGFVFRDYAGTDVDSRDGVLNMLSQSAGMANLRMAAEFYPMALFTTGILSNIGVVGQYERGLGGKTQGGDNPNTADIENGDELESALTAYELGLRMRLPVAGHLFGLGAAYGAHNFEIDDDVAGGPMVNLVPDVDYSYLRFGADFTYIMDAYHLTASLGLRIVNSAGEDTGYIQQDDWFPNSDVGGVDAGLLAGFDITERLTAQAGVDFRNFYYSMNSRQGDFGAGNGDDGILSGRKPIAGGARDLYVSGLLSISYTIR